MDDRRKGKLHHLFKQVLQGNDTIQSSSKAQRFIEALISEEDAVACVEALLSSSNGVLELQKALRVDVTTTFINNSASAALKYLRNRDIASTSGGELLKTLLIKIVDPPVFWKAFVAEAEAQTLNAETLHCFAWLLLQLVSVTGQDVSEYLAIAGRPAVHKVLSGAKLPETRNIYESIQHVSRTLHSASTDSVDGPGGRHDNDHKDFRQIALLPSVDELISEKPAFLRFASEIDEAASEERLPTQLDNQFRLLREDMLRDLKEELSGQTKKKSQRMSGLKLTDAQADGCSLREWTVEFICLSGLPFLPKKNREKWLKSHPRVLSHGSLACLIGEDGLIGFGMIVRNEDKLARSLPLLNIQLPTDPRIIARMMRGLRASAVIDIITMQTPIFAYEPVLRQLQNTRLIPLAEGFMTWEKAMPVPRMNTTTRLQSLLDDLACDRALQLQQRLDLPKSVKLNSSQAESFIAGLSQRVALIQGPPGTGKSFIGALIAKAIHQRSDSKILVLSYTNHALDQYLEDLIQVGIPQNDIVRLGVQRKATAAIKPLVLFDKMKANGYTLKRGDWSVIDSHKHNAANLEAKLISSFQDLMKTQAEGEILEYLEFSNEFQDYHEGFQLPDGGDFQLVGKSGRAANPSYLFKLWAKNRPVDQLDSLSEHINKYKHIWIQTEAERKVLLQRWKDDILAERLEMVLDYGQRYNREVLSGRTLKNEPGRRLLKATRVIGATTTSAAKMVSDIQAARPEIVIVEEAGEILESHILANLGPETKQLILIGDHKQLRPKAHYDLSVEKGTGYDLNRSLFERLILKGYPHHTLSEQHRMRPEISAFVRELTYPELTDAPGTLNRLDTKGLRDNIIFLNHSYPEEQGAAVYDPKQGTPSSSKTNTFEAEMTLRCVKYLAQQGYGSDKIVVLTPYLGQLRLLYDVLQAENDPVLNDLDTYDLVRAGLMPAATAASNRSQLRISTIDNYQGEESDIVVVSLTRSNPRGDIGFMAAPERLNVLISRARDAIIFLGNSETFLNAKKGGDVWKKFLQLLRDGHHIYDGLPVRCQRHPDREFSLTCPSEFNNSCPDGGCDAPCDSMLSCGMHQCPSKCHQLFDHSKMKCEQIMSDTCKAGHQRSWKCFSQVPTSCKACDREQKQKDELARKQHEAAAAKALRQKEHDEKMAKIEAEIEVERQRLRDIALTEEENRAEKLKLSDLEKMRESARRATEIKEKKLPDQTPATQTEDAQQARAAPSTIAPDPTAMTVTDQGSRASSRWHHIKQLQGTKSAAIDDLMKMTGLESVKSWALDILDQVQTAERQGLDITNQRLGTVLLGNPGTGKTTVARILAKLFHELNVILTADFVETTGAKLAQEGVPGTRKMVESLLNNGGGVIFIDEAYQLVSGNSFGGNAVLDYLLAEIENTRGKLIFMFAGYDKQMEKFFQHNPGLPSRMPHSLRFADYTEAELLHMFVSKVEKRYSGRMKVEDGLKGLYMRIAVRRLHKMSGREGFGNARDLENLLDKVVARQSARLSRERYAGTVPDDFWLSKEDIIGPEPGSALQQSQAWVRLQQMVGLDSVKASIQSLVDRLVDNYGRELREKPPVEVSLNRLFLGSPGTGKTTVARLYGQVLADIGMLSSAECLLKTPSDFIGSVLGESEKNTKSILENTKGKVLVIDEAYMLAGSSNADIYRTAVIDTIVSEVHSTPGEDRAVLLLGYKSQMEDMLRTSNPGLARRFPVESAFTFEDYNDAQLLAILNSKLKAGGLDATDEAKTTAIASLSKLRRRPNFGNAGEVENLLSRAKENHSKRQFASKLVSDDIVFSPEDFDPDVGRKEDAVVNCKNLFKDVVGAEALIDQMTGYIQSYRNALECDMDPAEVLPFNFVFKGPPGTGKTTTARKIGAIFRDMGFLNSDNVIDCSATDIIGQFVGSTGPKVLAKLDEALGQVLFIDEAYRLAGDNPYAKEAIDELVDSLTKEKYKGKMLVILAGYEDEINELLHVNPGLSSRFAEEVFFHNLSPELCLDLLVKSLSKDGKMQVDLDPTTDAKVAIRGLFTELIQLQGWANGRDVGTVARRVKAAVLKTPKGDKPPAITWPVVLEQLQHLSTERKKREVAPITRTPFLTKMPQAARSDLPQSPKVSTASQSTKCKPAAEIVEEQSTQDMFSQDLRDVGVSDAAWLQLQLDKEAAEKKTDAMNRTIEDARDCKQKLEEEAKQAEKHMEELREKAAEDDEARRRHEEMRLRAMALKRKADEEAEKMRLEELKRKQEQAVQKKLRHMGVCPVGFQWVKQQGGYRCGGGSHFVSDAQLGP